MPKCSNDEKWGSVLLYISNEEGNTNNDGSEKSHFWFALYFFVQVIRVLFLSP